MELLRNFEKKVISLLASTLLSHEQINEATQNAEFIEYDYTGCGYFLTIRHQYFPAERIVFSEPTLMGEVEDTECGFVIFFSNKELTLECHSWGEKEVSEDFRDKDVQIRVLVL
jgi:hypothetical protein